MKTKQMLIEVLDKIAILIAAFLFGALLRALMSFVVEAVIGVKWPWYLF